MGKGVEWEREREKIIRFLSYLLKHHCVCYGVFASSMCQCAYYGCLALLACLILSLFFLLLSALFFCRRMD